MMLAAVEIRYGKYRTPNRIQLLTDNGSCSTVIEKIDFGHCLRLNAKLHTRSHLRKDRND